MATKRFSFGILVLGLAAGLFCHGAIAAPQLPFDIGVSSTGTWLRAGPGDVSGTPTRLNLAAANIRAGDKLTLRALGGYDCSVGNNCGVSTSMLAVFVDAGNNLIFPDPALPVPFVVSFTSYNGGGATDVGGDFWVRQQGGTDVIVPAGAVALLFGPDDSFFSDNGNLGYGAYIGCGETLDGLIREFDNYSVPLNPKCRDFTQTRYSFYFGFSELNTGGYSWLLIRQPLIDSSLAYIGIDALRHAYGAARTINSAYRDPIRNASVGGATRSRHMFGDAADLRNVTLTMTEYRAMKSAARAAHADYIEPISGPCRTDCVHADWRNHPGSYHD